MDKACDTLLVLTPGFPSGEDDTTCLPFLQTHIMALNKRFPELEIIVLAFQYPFTAADYTWRGNRVVAFGGRERSRFHRLGIWVKVWRKLEHIRKRKNVVGLFSLWCTECALIGSYYGKYHRLTHATWLCGQDAKMGNRYVRLIRPAAKELVAMSDFLKREFFKNYGISPAHVIPLGVDGDEFPHVRAGRTIDVLGAGSLIPLKQYDVFVRVIAAICRSGYDVQGVLCGGGPERGKLEQLIAENNVGKNVLLKGEVPHAEVLSLMQQSRIFLHTSNYEGFGTVCLEALYAGAHVVSFTKPMDEAIAHWYHVESQEQMIEKVTELLGSGDTAYEPVCAYAAVDIAERIRKLFP